MHIFVAVVGGGCGGGGGVIVVVVVVVVPARASSVCIYRYYMKVFFFPPFLFKGKPVQCVRRNVGGVETREWVSEGLRGTRTGFHKASSFFPF